MTSTANGRVVPGQLESFGVPPFDGYPYLVTRIGHSALRHVALLPADNLASGDRPMGRMRRGPVSRGRAAACRDAHYRDQQQRLHPQPPICTNQS